MDIKEVLKDMTVYMLEEGLESIDANVHGNDSFDVKMKVSIEIIMKGGKKDDRQVEEKDRREN